LILCWPTLKQMWNVNSTWPSLKGFDVEGEAQGFVLKLKKNLFG
jgi:hypothetical protein